MAPTRRSRIALAALAACAGVEAAAQPSQVDTPAPSAEVETATAPDDERAALEAAIREEQSRLLDLISQPAPESGAGKTAAPAIRAAAQRLPALQRRLAELRRPRGDTGWQTQ